MSDQRIYDEIKEVRDKQLTQEVQLREHTVELKNQTAILSDLKDLMRNQNGVINKLSDNIGGIRENEKGITRLVAEVAKLNNNIIQLREYMDLKLEDMHREYDDKIQEIHSQYDNIAVKVRDNEKEIEPAKETKRLIKVGVISNITGIVLAAIAFLIGSYLNK